MADFAHGAYWMDVEHTDIRFPTGYWGDNGDTDINSSIWATAVANAHPTTRCIVYGLFVYGNAAGGTVTIYGADGTTVLKAIPIDATVLPGEFLPLGPIGFELPATSATINSEVVTTNGFGVKTSIGTLKVSLAFFTNTGPY